MHYASNTYGSYPNPGSFIQNFESWDKGFLYLFLVQSNFFLNALLIPCFTWHESEKYHLQLQQFINTRFSTVHFLTSREKGEVAPLHYINAYWVSRDIALFKVNKLIFIGAPIYYDFYTPLKNNVKILRK
jgi:hypothetical protein